MPVYVLMVWNAGCAFWDCVFCLTLFGCASVNGIAQTARSESKISALQRRIRVCFIDIFLCVFGFLVVTFWATPFLAAAQMCFCWVKRKPRSKPAKFFVALQQTRKQFLQRF